MSKSRLPLYLGLSAAGIGGYYLYQSGGDVDKARASAKADASKARTKLPTPDSTNKDDVSERATAYIDEILDAANTKAKEANGRLGDGAKESLERIDRIRQDTARSMNTTVDKLDRKVEEKAAEAKKSISGWFGGK